MFEPFDGAVRVHDKCVQDCVKYINKYVLSQINSFFYIIQPTKTELNLSVPNTLSCLLLFVPVLHSVYTETWLHVMSCCLKAR